MRISVFSKTLDCAGVKALLDDYSSGELAHERRLAMDQHLRNCPGCEKVARTQERLIILLERCDRLQPPQDLWQRVEREIGQPAVGYHLSGSLLLLLPLWQRLRNDRRGWAGVAAGAAAMAAVGLGVFTPHGQPTYPQAQHGSFSYDTLKHPSGPAAPNSSIEPASFVNQSQEIAMYDPLADRVSLGAAMVSGPGFGRVSAAPHFQISNVVSGNFGGSGQ